MVGCTGGQEEELIVDYKTIQSHADNSEWDKLYEGLDSKSQEFLTQLADSTNYEFDKLRKLGVKYGVPYTALVYYYDFGKVLGAKDVGNIFRFCSLTNTPKKIKFIKEDGINKLDFLGLLDRREKDFRIAYRKYYNGQRKVDAMTVNPVENDPLYIFMQAPARSKYFPKGYRYQRRDASQRVLQ